MSVTLEEPRVKAAPPVKEPAVADEVIDAILEDLAQIPVEVVPVKRVVDPWLEKRRNVLLEAADLIEDNYVAGTTYSHGNVCLIGAIGQANRTGHMSGYYVADQFLGVSHDRAYTWNDRLNHRRNMRPKQKGWRGWFGAKMTPGQTVALALRRMANGETFRQATRF